MMWEGFPFLFFSFLGNQIYNRLQQRLGSWENESVHGRDGTFGRTDKTSNVSCTPKLQLLKWLFCVITSNSSRGLTHSLRALFRVFDIEFGLLEDILGIILVKEFFKKSN